MWADHLAREVLGPADSDELLEITLLLRPQDRFGRRLHLHQQAHSTWRERTHLTHSEIAARHGIAPTDMERVERFARANDLRIGNCHPVTRLITLSGPMAKISRLFDVDIQHYRHELGSFRAHKGAVHLPVELAYVVEGVFGLDTAPLSIPHARLHPAHAKTGVPPNPDDVLHYTPPQLAEIYCFPKQTSGKGQCVALLEFAGGYNTQDLQTYFGRLGLKPPSIVDVPLAGASTSATGNLMLDGEVTLDIEVLGAAAPAAELVIYYAPNTTDGWVRAIHEVVADDVRKPSVLSISWGQVESQWPSQAVRAIEEALTTAALLGITVCASAGDHGSADGALQGAHVSYPASSSFVLACGGTKLDAAGNVFKDEVVWNEIGNPDAVFPGATGGGISELFPVPAFQATADVPPSANDNQTRGRGVPDVAANADPSSGYLVTVDGITTVSGGTSAAAPLWAALIARLNEALNSRVGLIHPSLYRLQGGSAFRAITSGNNGAYQARAGWNPCTGWGTPLGDMLLDALQSDKGLKSSATHNG